MTGSGTQAAGVFGRRGLSTTEEVEALIQANAPCAIGLSGGKDSCALAFAVHEYLDSRGHKGPRIFIHSDLGRVEWRESLPVCERLARRLNTELVVVRREAGDLLDRWLVRWRNNVARYSNLECVKLILPWSTATMPFCRSELKTAVICGYLVKRFQGQTILSACGIRREESTKRAKYGIAKWQSKLNKKGSGARPETSGLDWFPLLDWTKEDVFAYLEERSFALHEAYTRYRSSRVSCTFCILASKADLASSASCPENQNIYRELVELEITSTFSFRSDLWLGDVAPHLLDQTTRVLLEEAKGRARAREMSEARIPEHLLYEKGWPRFIPTPDEAELLCDVRREVAAAVGLSIGYTDPESLIKRYEDLMAQNFAKNGARHSEVTTPLSPQSAAAQLTIEF